MKNRHLHWLLLLLFPFFCVELIQAQGWEKIYPRNTPFEYSYSSVPTSDGGSLLAGYTTDPTNTYKIGMLVKIDERGNRQNTIINVDTANTDVVFYDIKKTPDNGFIVGGMSRSVGNFNGFNFYLVKYDSTATVEWQRDYFTGSYSGILSMGMYNVEVTPDSGYICTGLSGSRNRVIKTDALGNVEWDQTYGDPLQAGTDIEIMPNQSGYMLLSTKDLGSSQNYRKIHILYRLDMQGDTLWTKEYDSGHSNLRHGRITLTAGGELAIASYNYQSASNRDGWVAKLDTANGAILWETFLKNYDIRDAGYALENTLDNGLIVTGSTSSSQPNTVGIIKFDSTGQIEWSQYYGPSGIATRAYCINVLPDSTYVLAGHVMWGIFKVYALKIDSQGEQYRNIITGKVYYDRDSSCSVTAVDLPMERRILYAFKDSNSIYYSATDEDGNYSFRVDTGDYSILLAENYRDAYFVNNGCLLDTSRISTLVVGDSSSTDFPQVALVNCSLVEVNMGTPMLRRCFPGYYSISYCNYGTEEAYDADIEVVLDPYLIVDTNNLPGRFTVLPNNTFIFTIDSITIGECGYFQIPLTVDCDSTILGQTHCSQVSITPDTNCVVPPWQGANIQLDATCLGDSIRVVLRNVGGNMTTPLNYLVYEDNVMLRNQSFQLGAGQSQNFQFEATGNTYRIEAQQPVGFPSLLGDSIVAKVIERCNGINSLGLVTSLPNYDGSPFLDIDCRENIGAYDPNDKRGFPSGVGTAHYITKNDKLDYHIRFQNTGTDTAFTVVIVDTIDPALDIRTLRTGASSHPYTMQVYGEQEQIVAFTFNNIMLPDSNVNEPLSHGFIQFTIEQQANNPIGTIINNEAAIYFDFNAPIFTNTTLHTVGENFIQVVLTSVEGVETTPIAVKVIPNPFQDQAVLKIEGVTGTSPLQLQVFNVMGQQVLFQQSNQHSFQLQRGNLETGVYLFRIVEEGQVKATGKFIVD